MNSNEIRENEIDERLDIEKMKLENNEDQAAERIRIAEEKLDIARKRVKNNEKKSIEDITYKDADAA